LAIRSVNASILLGLVTMIAMLIPYGPVAQGTAAVGLIILVGATLTSWFDLSGSGTAQRIAVTLGVGFLVVLVFFAFLGATLSHMGVQRPLARVPVVVSSFVVIVAILGSTMARGVDPVGVVLERVTARHLWWTLLLSLPPLLALVGVIQLNVTRNAAIAILTGALVIALATLAVALPLKSGGPPRIVLLLSAMLTAAWQGPMRGGWMAGSDIQHEYNIGSLALHQATFPLLHYVDPYGGMLSLTVWPAVLHALTGVQLRTILVLVPSLLLACCLLASWATIRERLGERSSALLCALFIVGSEPLLHEMPQLTRQCYALFFLALLVMAVTSRRLDPKASRMLACASGIGIAVTHYSSAYLAAGAVILGCALTICFRTERRYRVLTLPVTSTLVGVTLLWGGFVARTGRSIGQVLSSIRADGFNFLPGSTDFLTRWLHGASISQLVNANVIYANDQHLRATQYRWMHVDSRALNILLANSPAPTARGIPVVGPVLSFGSAALAEVLLLAAVASVGICLWRCRQDRRLAGLAGVALFFTLVSVLSRLSQTIGVDFGPSRVQAQAYLVFVVTIAVAVEGGPLLRYAARWARSDHRRGIGMVVAGALCAALAVATSTQLSTFAEHKAQLPVEYSATGEDAQRLLVPADLLAAHWVALHRPARFTVQADRFAQLGLYVYGYSDRRNFFGTVDPIVTDDGSWIFADRTNVIIGTARGGNNAEIGVFQFPGSYFAATRSMLYVSPTDIVFGSIPPGSRQTPSSVTIP
jgi:hypothetical protein